MVHRLTGVAYALVAALATQGACFFDSSGIAPSGPGAPDLALADRGPGMDTRVDGTRADAAPIPDGPLFDVNPWPDQLHPDAPPQDSDGDKVPDISDNCPTIANAGQADSDGDKVGNLCDNCPAQANAGQADADKDTVGDLCDNCPQAANAGQHDLDSDGLGNACDPDKDGDSLPNDIDPAPLSKDTVHYYKTPGPASGDFTKVPYNGWTSGTGGALCHKSTTDAEHWTHLKGSLLSATNYLAQTHFSVGQYTSSYNSFPGVGLAFRIQNTTKANYYLCLLDPKSMRVVLGRIYNGIWGEYKDSGNYSVSASPTSSYTMRVIAEGKKLTCQLMGGPTVTYGPSTYGFTTGTVGFFSSRVEACFDYLLVTAAP